MSASLMAFVEINSIAGHEPSHGFAEWSWPDAQEKMEVIGDQSPGIALCLRLFEDKCNPIEKGSSVEVILEFFSTFYSSGHYMLEKAGGVESSIAGHRGFLKVAADWSEGRWYFC